MAVRELDDPQMVGRFIRETCAVDPIDREVEGELSKDSRRGKHEARNRLALSNMRFVVSVCNQYAGRGVSVMDLYIEGFLGLCEAAKRFESESGIKFTSYAIWWIKQKILIAIANQQPGYSRPIRFFMDHKSVRDGDTEGMTPEAVAKTKRLAEKVLSTESGAWRRIGDSIVSDAPSTEAAAEQASVKSAIDKALGGLPARDRKIIELSFGLGGHHPQNLREVGEIMGICSERIRQIKNGSLALLKRSGVLKELCRTH